MADLKTRSPHIRTYHRQESIVFYKTKESFGGLSNMASGYPLAVNGLRVLTSEALYQACRFPHLPRVQRSILDEKSPMSAKMKSKHYRDESREDWMQIRKDVMRWCLRVKLVQHREKFGDLLRSTGNKPIVEQSRGDSFWGAIPSADSVLVGHNVLGRFLMELREEYLSQADQFAVIYPPEIQDFLLCGKQIEVVTSLMHSYQNQLLSHMASDNSE